MLYLMGLQSLNIVPTLPCPPTPPPPLSNLARVYGALSYCVRTLRVRALSITVQAGHLASRRSFKTLAEDTIPLLARQTFAYKHFGRSLSRSNLAKRSGYFFSFKNAVLELRLGLALGLGLG